MRGVRDLSSVLEPIAIKCIGTTIQGAYGQDEESGSAHLHVSLTPDVHGPFRVQSVKRPVRVI